MAFSRLERITFSFSLLSCLFLVAVFTPPSFSADRTPPSDSGKVSMALYYESPCPYSANFIVNYLVKLFKDEFISIVDLKRPIMINYYRQQHSYRAHFGYRSKCLLVVNAISFGSCVSKPITECYSSGHACYVCNACNDTTALKACSKFSLITMDGANEGSLGQMPPLKQFVCLESSKSTRSVGCNEGKMAAVRGRIGSTITSWIRQMNLAILI
ncbi:unnamed protein product [Malus baccata var. baccata]